MHCSDFDKYAQAYVDGEFVPADEAEFDNHLASCQSCRQQVARLEGFKRFMSKQPGEVVVPTGIRKAILQHVADNTTRGTNRKQWGALAAAALLSTVILTFNLLRTTHEEASADADMLANPLVDTSIDLHQRNLPVEVTGPDTNMVSEWVSNHVDFPVRLPSFQNPQIRVNVLGARLNRIDNREAAQVVYEVEGNKLSVVIFRAQGERLSRIERGESEMRLMILNRNGYNVAILDNGGITYSFTSSLPQTHLRELIDNAFRIP